MYERFLDILRGLGSGKYEIEMRIAVPPQYFEVARTWFDNGENAQCSKSKLQYSDYDDLRCVDGTWENKRVIDASHVHILGEMRAKVVASVELPAMQPENVTLYNLVRDRLRWSYTMGNWRVDWSKTQDWCIVEAEWTGGDVEELCSDPMLDRLGDVLKRLIPCIAFLAFADSVVCTTSHGILVKPFHSIGLRTRQEVEKSIRCQQPHSLKREHIQSCVNWLVSVKYDGMRAAMIFTPIDGMYICFSFGRMSVRNRAAYHPCQACSRPMILDGELMENGQFIAFDLISLDDRMCKHQTFSERIAILGRLEMPTLYNKKIKIKQFWAASEVSQAIQDGAGGTDSDGLVFHNPSGALTQTGTMYKWKPSAMHTVDLMINPKYILRTRKVRIQTLDPAHQDKCKPGEIWEFSFSDGTNTLTPVRLRTDKQFPNSDETYRDVKQAFKDNITAEELLYVLS